MRRIAAALSIVALLLLLAAPAVMAAGGGNPPPFEVKVVGPSVNATILMDPHPGGQATVNIGNGQSQASFAFVSDFPVTQGCVTGSSDLGNPAQRFLFTQTNQKNLTDWVPPFVLQSLFAPLGIVTFPNSLPGGAPVFPAITQIISAQCLPAANTGWLLMNVKIQFLVPR
jgi:hypothetical protein